MALALWVGVLLGLTRFGAEPPAVFVPFFAPSQITGLPDDIRIVDMRSGGWVLHSENTALAARLYALGAPLVFPAGLPACVSIPRSGPAAS